MHETLLLVLLSQLRRSTKTRKNERLEVPSDEFVRVLLAARPVGRPDPLHVLVYLRRVHHRLAPLAAVPSHEHLKEAEGAVSGQLTPVSMQLLYTVVSEREAIEQALERAIHKACVPEVFEAFRHLLALAALEIAGQEHVVSAVRLHDVELFSEGLLLLLRVHRALAALPLTAFHINTYY